jgi:hypothetical protein
MNRLSGFYSLYTNSLLLKIFLYETNNRKLSYIVFKGLCSLQMWRAGRVILESGKDEE